MNTAIDLNAKEHPLPEPTPLIPDTGQAIDYPLAALPPLMRSAAEAIAEHVQAPLPLAGQVVIGAATCLAQTRANAPHLHRPDGMPCSLFMLTLANSGDRKSECRRLAFKVIDDLERENRNRHREQCNDVQQEATRLKSKERAAYLEANPLPPDPRTQYSDTTFEPLAGDMIRGTSAAVWDTDEGGQMLGGSSLKSDTRTATLGGLCKAFDNGFFERTRSASNAEGSGFAYHRRLSVILLAQEAAVADALRDPLLRGQGFLPRFLFTSTTSLAGSRFLTPEKLARKSYTDSRLQQYWERCRDIQAQQEYIDALTNEVAPPVMLMQADAERIWLEFYNEIEREQSTLGEFFQSREFASRAGELARRLSTVFSVFEQQTAITAELMRGACEIVRHTCREWSRYRETASPHPDLVQARALFDWLTDPARSSKWHTFHKNDLTSQGPTRSRSKLRDRLLTLLVKHAHLLTDDGKTYRINPKALTGAESAESAEGRIAPAAPSAEAVHKSAQTPRPPRTASPLYAPLCSSSAPENPATTGLYADYALYAGAASANEEAEYF